MADRLNNIELLIMLSEDVCSQGDELTAEMVQRGRAHAQRVQELTGMLDKARALLDRERQRFSHYLPPERPRETMPRAVTKGPSAQSAG